MTVRDALNSAMEEEMLRDETVFVMGEEVARYNGAYKVGSSRPAPDRVFAEPCSRSPRAFLTSLAKSASSTRPSQKWASQVSPSALRSPVSVPCPSLFLPLSRHAQVLTRPPSCEFMTFNFAMQAIDQIVNSAGKTYYMSGGNVPCPVVFRGPNGAAAGVGAQHSQDYASWYGQIPGLKVISPWSAEDCRGLLKAAIRDPNPVVFLENEMLYGVSFPISQAALSEDFTLEIGKAKVEREGSDITLVAHSKMVTHALEAAEILEKEEGVKAEVINLRSIRPLDIETIKKSIKKTNRCVQVMLSRPRS